MDQRLSFVNFHVRHKNIYVHRFDLIFKGCSDVLRALVLTSLFNCVSNTKVRIDLFCNPCTSNKYNYVPSFLFRFSVETLDPTTTTLIVNVLLPLSLDVLELFDVGAIVLESEI